jgi:hypothetical protein
MKLIVQMQSVEYFDVYKKKNVYDIKGLVLAIILNYTVRK